MDRRGGQPIGAKCWARGIPPTFRRVILNRLLEGGDVTEGAEKQDNFVLLVPDWRDLHEKPNRHPCSTEISRQKTNLSGGEGQITALILLDRITNIKFIVMKQCL